MLALLVAAAMLVSPAPTVRLTTPHPIGALAASGGRLAYLNRSDCAVRLGSRVISVSEDAFCAGDRLALAGGRVAWGGFREVKCSDDYWIVAAGPPGRVVEHRDYGCDQGGSTPPRIAGAGSSLYYSFVEYEESADCVDTGGSCVFMPSRGTLVRLSHGRRALVRGVPPAALLAAAPGRVAIVRAARRFTRPIGAAKPAGTYPLPATGPLEVRDGTTGRLLRSFPLPGPAEAMTLTRSVAAAVTIEHGSRTLRWYGSRTGSLALGKAAVLALAADGDRIAVETARRISVIDTASATETATWTLAGSPAGLSADGGHVLWAENRAGRGRILEAPLA